MFGVSEGLQIVLVTMGNSKKDSFIVSCKSSTLLVHLLSCFIPTYTYYVHANKMINI